MDNIKKIIWDEIYISLRRNMNNIIWFYRYQILSRANLSLFFCFSTQNLTSIKLYNITHNSFQINFFKTTYNLYMINICLLRGQKMRPKKKKNTEELNASHIWYPLYREFGKNYCSCCMVVSIAPICHECHGAGRKFYYMLSQAPNDWCLVISSRINVFLVRIWVWVDPSVEPIILMFIGYLTWAKMSRITGSIESCLLNWQHVMGTDFELTYIYTNRTLVY